MTDRLSLTNALADAGIDRQKAERIATEIFDAIHDNVATTQDLHNLEGALKTDIERLEARIDQVAGALGARIDQVEAALRGEIAAIRAEMRELELRLEARIDRVVVRLGSLIVVLVGVLLAAIRYLPHN
jgi:hypothetical protein